MYKLEFLPVAKNDMLEIIKYISDELKNPVAASSLQKNLFHPQKRYAIFRIQIMSIRRLNHLDWSTEE